MVETKIAIDSRMLVVQKITLAAAFPVSVLTLELPEDKKNVE